MSEERTIYDATAHLSPEDKKKFQGYVKEISNSMTRMDAEKDLIKDIIAQAKDDFELSPKDVRKIAKIYHKQSYIEEKSEQEKVFDLYEQLFD